MAAFFVFVFWRVLYRVRTIVTLNIVISDARRPLRILIMLYKGFHQMTGLCVDKLDCAIMPTMSIYSVSCSEEWKKTWSRYN